MSAARGPAAPPRGGQTLHVAELYPFLAVRDVQAAVDFYAAAFGATEEGTRAHAPDGSQVAILTVVGHHVGVATESIELGTPSPETAGVTTVRLSLEVDDPDAVQARAVTCGATERFAVADQPYGYRQGRVIDPFGHHWLIGRPIEAAN